ncbi:MAG: rhodanese-like domain-containing protein [Bernardetiaceae bacterium]
MQTQEKAKSICPTTTQKWLAKGALLVDVREADEAAAVSFDVPAQLHIPISAFETRWEEIPRDREVVLACKSGGRSLRATYFLLNQGYDRQRVVNMQSGIVRWAQKGFPIQGDAQALLSGEGDCCSTPGCC